MRPAKSGLALTPVPASRPSTGSLPRRLRDSWHATSDSSSCGLARGVDPVGPPPQTLEPRVALLIVGICTTGPNAHSQPLTGLLGDRNAENVVGPAPKGTVFAGCSDGCQISGRIVRVMMFQSSVMWIGMTG